nr:hypothetical protein [Tanacetum cinerariifolium]
MSFGSQSVGELVIPKFDMHTYISTLTDDEVNNLVKEYAIPLDLHPRVPPSTLIMKNLHVDKIDPPPAGVRAVDIRRLCENEIDLRLVHPTMLYEIGLMTIWKHAGHHLAFKDGERNACLSFLNSPWPCPQGKRTIARHTTQPLPSRTPILNNSDHQKEGPSCQTKEKKTAPISMALSESDADDSNQNDYGTHHFEEHQDTHPGSDGLHQSEGCDNI